MFHMTDTAGSGFIRVRGARENNLKSVDLDIPKHRLTVFTGVSGSGKSSLVHDTIAAEATRQLNATHTAFIQGMLDTPPSPDVDSLTGITATIELDQEPMGANPRSTVGTATDVDAMLRVLFSRAAEPRIGGPKAYSFNVPSVSGAGAIKEVKGGREVVSRASFSITGGMCPRCEGRGSVSDIDLAALYDETLSINEGAILIPGFKVGGWSVRQYAESGLFPADQPIAGFTKRQLEDLLYAEGKKVRVAEINMTYMGLVPRVRQSLLSKDPESLQPHMRAFVDRLATFQTCPECAGTRLSEGARTSRIGGLSIADASAMQVSDLAAWVASLDIPEAGPLLARLGTALDAMVTIGLGYLSLSRSTGSLSGGESQRVRLVRQMGSSLSDLTYVFDEPTTGLHPHDVARMNTLLKGLRDQGNTVLIIEHDPATIAIADHVVDMGPGAGASGGRVVYEGDVAGLAASGTKTGAHLAVPARLKGAAALREPGGALRIEGARTHNLDGVSVDVPLGMLVAVTGVAGSGKSSLIPGSLPKGPDATVITQEAIKGSARSNAATWTGMLEPIRKAFAKAHGVKPALFSANSEGACPECKGLGVITTELGFMESVSVTCDACQGRRFDAAVLEYRLGGLSIADVLDLSAARAAEFFARKESRVAAAARLAEGIAAVGLGYLGIGQPLSTLSGGERQRLKLAVALGSDAPILVLDEPTTGLHPADVDALVDVFDRIVDEGRSVILVEHDPAVIARADWVIDLGPGAGTQGGRIVFEGRPADLASCSRSLTGHHLALALEGAELRDGALDGPGR